MLIEINISLTHRENTGTGNSHHGSILRSILVFVAAGNSIFLGSIQRLLNIGALS